MQMTKLLNAKELQGIKLIAGMAGMDRDATLIGMIEAPDIESYLFSGQLLVTTGYHYYQHIDRLKELIKKMAAIGCAGLGIKANRYFKQIPTDIIQLANTLKFPLLLTPAEEPLSQTVSSLIQVVIQADALKLSRVIQQNQTLSKLALNNTKFNIVLDQCATYLKHDIVLLDSHFRVCYANRQIWDQREKLSSQLRQTSQLDYLSLSKETTVQCGQHDVHIFPLMVMYPENKSFIGILDLETLTSTQQLQLQQIQNIISLMNSRTDVRKEDTGHQRNEFFSNVVTGRIRGQLSEQQPAKLAVDLSKNCYCSLLGLKPAQTGVLLFLNQSEQIRRLTDWFIDEYQIAATSFVFQQQLILIISATQNPVHFLEALANFLKKSFGDRYLLKIGLSHAKFPAAQLPTLYQEAQEAYTLAEQSDKVMQRFRPKEVSELLQLIPHNEAQSFINETLGPLLHLKNHQEVTDLLQTLQLYLYNHQQINLVAKQLFIHRNTVVYRLKKTSEILNIDLKDPAIAQRLQVALLLTQSNQ